MFNFSFYNGTLDKTRLRAEIKKTKKPILYTYGFKSKNPTTYEEKITKKRAYEIISTHSLLDATEYEDYIGLNAYSVNDMW